jgi:iron complex outermembrane receptor protein
VNNLKYRKLVTLTSAIALSAFASEVSAQSLALEEITVTARKRDETLLDVPLSITALSAAQLEKFNLQSMEEMSRMTPGMFYTDFGGTGRQDRGSSQFVVRGLSVNNFSNSASAAVMFVDGIPVYSGNTPGTLDIERIEVLKGPQTATFGRNTFTGAISVVTRDPGNEWSSRLVAEYANYDSTQLGLSVEGPIIEDKVSFRLSGEARNEGAQYQSSATSQPLGGQTTTSLWGTLKLTPSEQLTVRASLNLFKYRDDPGAHVRFIKRDHTCDTTGDGIPDWFCGVIPEASDNDSHARFVDQRWLDNTLPILQFPNFNDKPGLKSENLHASLKVNYTFDNGIEFQTLTGYDTNKDGNIQQEWSSDAPNRFFGVIPGVRPDQFWLYSLEGKANDFSQEVRISSASDQRLRWSIGGNYLYFSTVGSVRGDVSLGAPLNLPGARRQTNTWSGFGSIYYDIQDNLELGLEARYQSDKIKDTPRFWTPAPGTPLKGTWKEFTPRVSLKYKPSDDTTLFALWARGSRPGAFNSNLSPGALAPGVADAVAAATGAMLEVDQEKLDSYDIGIKHRFAEGRGNFTLTGYTGAITNQQVAQNITLLQPSLFIGTVLTNTGKIGLKGIEFDINYQLTDEFNVAAAYSINDTSIKRGDDLGIRIFTGGDPNVLGNRLQNAPKTQGFISGTYTSAFNSDMDWYAGADMVYIGSKYVTNANLAKTGSQYLLNARIGLEMENMRIELWGKNILGDETPDQAFDAFDYETFTPTALNIGLPKKTTYGLRVNYDF